MKKKTPNHRILIYIISILFFVVSVFTLKDYGISWDEPLHFSRGQAFFNYLRTGEKTYDNVNWKRSYYQIDSMNGEYFFEKDSAHPPANDILAAFSNFVFFQKLEIMGDIESHHLFNVVASSLLVLTVCIFAYEAIGLFPSIVSGLVMATYPLFFAESHFNIKDPAETAFFTLSIYFFWKLLEEFRWKYVVYFGLSVGFALGVKFNIVFLPFILLPYLLAKYWKKLRLKPIKTILKIPKKYYFALAISVIIIMFVFLLFWPYLWEDPLKNVIDALKYYRDIGSGTNDHQLSFLLPGGINTFPIYWILITTPPLVIFLTLVGTIDIIKNKKFKKASFLWLLLLIIPILRVTIPGTAIYGGIRQIMEFIPGMALVAGVGAFYLVDRFKNFKNLKVYVVIVSFLLLVSNIVRLHPNENVYFNFIVGGLSGAKEKKVPYWGNSFGNGYLQVANWLNDNVEEGSKIALVQGISTNIPKIYLRNDISFSNGYWSGIDRGGEYLVELTHDDPVKVYPYVWGYVERFLKPVYEVEVDGVAIAKVWKNDLENTVGSLRKEEVQISRNLIQFWVKDNQININLNVPREITRVKILYGKNSVCGKPRGHVEVLKDQDVWVRKEESLPANQMNRAYGENEFSYFFLADKTNEVKFTFDDADSCALINPVIHVFALK